MDELLTQVSFIFAWPEDTPHDGVGSRGRVGLAALPSGFPLSSRWNFHSIKRIFRGNHDVNPPQVRSG